MRIREIVNARIDADYLAAFNSATGNSLTLDELQDAAFEIMSDETLQADLAKAADYKRQVEANIANLQRLVANHPDAVEAATITQAITDMVTIFTTPYDQIGE